MPDMDGIEFMMQFKRDQPQVHFIVMSGGGIFNHPELLDTAKYLGALEIFKKPFSSADLLTTVKEALAV
jgi:YesN/AraC family two-component response regulator